VKKLLLIPLALSFMLIGKLSLANEEVIVYSARKEHLIKPLFDLYTKETGVEIKYITDKAGPLLHRLQAEGKRTPADMFITVDAGNLWQAAEKGVLASIDSEILNKNIPEHLRDDKNRWFGLSVRARTIVYSTERIKEGELSTYEDLADVKFKNRLCLRTSKKVYNQSLVATMISRHGKVKTQKIIEGWVTNLAMPPFSNDTKTMKAIASGHCDVGIVNTYYFGRLLKKEPETKLALFWPNQTSTGVHVNISGAGVTKHAKHPAAAKKLLEWLSSESAQALFASLNMEYPANKAVESSEVVDAWGEFKADDLNVAEAGRLQSESIKLMDRAGYR